MRDYGRHAALFVGAVFGLAAAGQAWLLQTDSDPGSVRARQGLVIIFVTLSVLCVVGVLLANTGASQSGQASPLCENERMMRAIVNEHRNGRFFMVLGTLLAALGGVLILWLQPDSAPPVPEAWVTTLSRVGPVLLIELTAFYFLRLHRASLANVKYYQNELTNLDARAHALRLLANASERNAPFTATEVARMTSSVVEHLMRTERNKVLEKGQTTEAQREALQERALLEKVLEALTGQGTAKR
jgi:hypothetical protein